jgi:hypothetical protein
MSVSLRSKPSPSSGKCNSGIELVTVDGRVLVRRLYDQGIVDEPVMRWQLAVAADAGLVRDPEWLIEVVPEGTWVSNPHQTILQLDDVPTTVLWKAYEEFLERLKKMYMEHGAIVSDAHSANIVLCADEDDPARLYIVDGKVAGIQTDPSLRRLAVKYKHEQIEEHRWLLWEYSTFLKNAGAA